ncbi:hypothetical protein [Acrocarpospora phusangensis]|nr:hypothetical protein [Acrocarpospora phusangensis]
MVSVDLHVDGVMKQGSSLYLGVLNILTLIEEVAKRRLKPGSESIG